MAFRRFITATEFHVFLGFSASVSTMHYFTYRSTLKRLDQLEADETVKQYTRAKAIEKITYSIGIIGLVTSPAAYWKAIIAGGVVWSAAVIFAANRTATARIRAGNQFNGAELRAWNLAVYSQ